MKTSLIYKIVFFTILFVNVFKASGSNDYNIRTEDIKIIENNIYVKISNQFAQEISTFDLISKIKLIKEVYERSKDINIIYDERTDIKIRFTDPNGEILYFSKKANTLIENELTFSFNSPLQPWSFSELNTLKKCINDFYVNIKYIFGNPFTSDTVNIVKDSNLGAAAIYGLNTITIKSASANLDVLCHEMIHAFSGELIKNIWSYEEGMTRSIEIKVMDRLRNYSYWNHSHSYNLDVFYELHNNRKISERNGNIGNVLSMLLLSYQVSAYAWTKIYIEDNDFFKKYNELFYQKVYEKGHSNISEDDLSAILFSVRDSVENTPIKDWYKRQYIFKGEVPDGAFIYSRISYDNQTADCLERFTTPFGWGITPIINANVTWHAYDYQNNILDQGNTSTNMYGVGSVEFSSIDKPVYERIKVISSFDNRAKDTVYRTIGYLDNYLGVFGVITFADSGTIKISNMFNSDDYYSTIVSKGFFLFPTLYNKKGSFRVTFKSHDNIEYTRVFNKDASSYFLLIDKKTSDVTNVLSDYDPKINFELFNNYPNPFNPTTTIIFQISQAGNVKINIFDISGRLIKQLINEQIDAGEYSTIWDGRDNNGKKVSSGIYFYQIISGEFIQSKKMILLK